MESNLFFLAGPQGAGKSTLIKHLVDSIPQAVSPVLSTKTPQFYWDEWGKPIDFFHRQALKSAQRAIENYEYFSYATNNPDKLVVGDRCVYDTMAYINANKRLGWITSQQETELLEMRKTLHYGDLYAPRAIVLNPGPDIARRNLESRWKKDGKWKFMEDDLDFLKAVCDSYEQFRSNPQTLYLDKPLNLNQGIIPDEISGWISEFFLQN